MFFKESLEYAFDFFGKVKDVNEISIEAILSVVTILVPAKTSLVVAFVEIPKIIAQYLFNVQEDNFMDSVIKIFRIMIRQRMNWNIEPKK